MRIVVKGRILGVMVRVRGRKRRRKRYGACRIGVLAVTGGW